MRIGCSGWVYSHWRGIFYPQSLPQRRWLEYYSERFNTVELNSAFYRFPRPSAVHAWLDQTPKGFKFTLKVHRRVTHRKKFLELGSTLRDFYEIGESFGDKLGCFLFQFPGRWSFTEERLERVCAALDSGFKNVLEFRNLSWWNPQVFRRLEEERVAFCSVNVPFLPDVRIKTAPHVYVRLHGSEGWYYGKYSRAAINALADWLRKTAARSVWIYFDNDAHADAPGNARELATKMARSRL